MIQAVWTAVQRRGRLPLHFRLQGGDAFGGQVGKVGDDNVHRLGQGFQQVAFQQGHPVGHVVHPHVVGGHVQGGVVGVAGVDAGGGQVDGQVDGDGPGAGAHVGDDQFAAFHAHQRHEERVLHHGLSFGTGNEHVPVYQQVDAVKFTVIEDVGQRLAGQSPLHDGRQLLLLLGRNLGFLLGEDGLPRHPHHIHDHYLRLQAGVGYAGRFQGAMGVLDDGAKIGHGGSIGRGDRPVAPTCMADNRRIRRRRWPGRVPGRRR